MDKNLLADGLYIMANYTLSVESKPNYHNDVLVDATIVVTHVLLDKMLDLMEYDGISKEQMELMVSSFGLEFNKLVKTYTGLDLNNISKNYGK